MKKSGSQDPLFFCVLGTPGTSSVIIWMWTVQAFLAKKHPGMKRCLKIAILACLLVHPANVKAVPEADGLYATLQTTMGEICLELDYLRTPMTTANFIALIEGERAWVDPRNGRVVTNRYYDNILFHRVITNFMIQAGSPQATGSDGPGYVFADEFHHELRHNAPGTLSMANSGPQSNGGQFFITVTNTPWLDDKHTVFGSVAEGMDVVYAITGVETGANSRPLVDIVITQAFVSRIGPAAQSFNVHHPALPEVSAVDVALALTTGPVASVSANARQQAVLFSSTNLHAWSRFRDRYQVDGATNWTVVLPATNSPGFITGHRVSYPADTNTPSDITGAALTLTFPVNIFLIQPLAGSSGTCQINSGASSPVTYWAWDRRPLQGALTVQSLNYVPLYFELFHDAPSRGRCRGYSYNGLFWSAIENGAIGTFTNQTATP